MSNRWVMPTGHGPLAFDPVESAHGARRRPAAFLDRDGVINETAPDPDTGLPESPLRVEDVRLLPGVAAALGKLTAAGYALVCVSNQPAAAKGKASIERLCAIHERVLELLAHEGVDLHASRLCPHHPDGVVAGLSRRCNCRKPAPGMLLDAASSLKLDLSASWIFGDTDGDMRAGLSAGCRTALVEYAGSAHKRLGGETPDLRAADLPMAVVGLLDSASG